MVSGLYSGGKYAFFGGPFELDVIFHSVVSAFWNCIHVWIRRGIYEKKKIALQDIRPTCSRGFIYRKISNKTSKGKTKRQDQLECEVIFYNNVFISSNNKASILQ